jgi:DNA repair ATPase RecN
MDDKLDQVADNSETALEKKLVKTKGLPRARQNERWHSLQSHLDQALNQWNEITEQMQDELSPDQKRLQEVKQLLNQLKVKLEEF